MTRTLQNRLRRQRAKRQVLFLVLGCSVVVGLVFLVFSLTSSRYPGGDGSSQNNVATAGEVVEPPQETQESPDGSMKPLSLGLGGDIGFGLGVEEVIEDEGPDYPWLNIAPVLGDYDFAVANLEGPLCRSDQPHPDQPSFCVKGDASCAAPMAAAGLDAVCLANDHSMDYGVAGLEETLNTLRSEKISTFGAGPSSAAAEQPLVLEADNGARLAMLSFCDVAPLSYVAGEESPGISSPSLDRLAESVRQAAADFPYVVVFLHWGEVGSTEITLRQIELARTCARAGADLVVGCHPHVVQGMEIYGGVPIIYSLGNLVFCSESQQGKEGIFAGCRFSGGRLTGLEIIPLGVGGASPAPLAGGEAENVLRRFDEASPEVEMDISPVTGIAIVKL